MEESHKWNEKYAKREIILKNPEDFIVQNYNNLKKGSILDLASGDGRNSIFLAKKGFSVTAVDYSKEALKRISYFALNENLNIKTKCLNLSKKESFSLIGTFDNIIINYYKVEDSLISSVEKILNTDGILIYCTFNIKQHLENGFDKDFCLKPRELLSKFSLNLLKYESFNLEKRYVDAYIFKK